MLKITPNLWFDHSAREASEFYTSIFLGSKISGGAVARRFELHNVAFIES